MSDEELYQSFLDGDEECLAQLIDKLGNPLVLYLYGYTKNIHDAEDVMMDAFAYMATRKPKIRGSGFKAYLYKVAKHMAFRVVKKKEAVFFIELEFIHQLPDESMLLSDLVQTKERNHILYMCMQELNSDYREALYLVYFEGLSHKEAAAVMGKREKQVSDLIFRGRKSLKVILERKGFSNA